MTVLSTAKRIALAGVAMGALGAASTVHARSEVHLSIGVPQPVYVQPAPVYVQPRPVYVQPQPVYVQPRPVYLEPRPVYMQPRPVYVQPAPVYMAPHARAHHGWDGRGGWAHQRPHGHRFGPHGDLDRDGVPNAHDRDRDGDGIRNRHDRVPNDRFRY